MDKFTFKDTIIDREIKAFNRYAPILCDKEGNTNPPIVRRSIYCAGTFIESFDFDSLTDPDNTIHKQYWAKYG